MRHRIGLAVVLFLVIVPTGATAAQSEGSEGAHAHHDQSLDGAENADLRRELARISGATAKFHRIPRAQAAGYDLMPPLHGCIQNPGVGAMGYHYFNQELIADLSVDPLRPEAMVYEPLANGKLRLAAVEWVVPAAAWHAAGNTEPPKVLGYDMHILNPAVGWYIFHAWIFKRNPAGIFEDWNPDVICP
jgi:hypothetical protein